MPPDIQASVETWRAATHAGGHEHRVWDDASIRALLVEASFPAIRAIYERLPDAARGIRADIARLVVLFRFGGLYADADTRVLEPHALFEYFESALRDGADAVVGTTDVNGSRRWIDAVRRPSNFVLACPRGSRFVRAYLESIARDFATLRFADRIGVCSRLRVRRLTKSWTGPRKLRALLRSGGEPWTIRLTPVGFVASGGQTCFTDAALAHDYKSDWYDKSRVWQALRAWSLSALLDAPLDRGIGVLIALSVLAVLAMR